MTSAVDIDGPSRVAPSLRGTVLYVEDHPADAALMVDYLGGFDEVSLFVAPSLERAIDVAREVRPSVVLLDVDMLVDAEGIDVFARLRALPEMQGTSIVGLSGTAHPLARTLSRHLGFRLFLTKPIDLSALGEAIESTLTAATERDAARASDALRCASSARRDTGRSVLQPSASQGGRPRGRARRLKVSAA